MTSAFLIAVRARGAWAAPLALAALVAACGPQEASRDVPAEGDLPAQEGDAPAEETQEEAETEPGSECRGDGDCDDHVDCTVDACADGWCANVPDGSRCDDGLECNGREVCNREQGCLPGEIFRDCIDGNPCTLDICIEGEPGKAPHCEFPPLDRDGDGHIDVHCPGGDDCNDLRAEVYPGAREWCFDTLDNDCDGKADRADDECVLTNDACATPRAVAPGAREEGFTIGALADVASSCDGRDYKDVVFTFTLAEARDVTVTVTGREGFYPYVDVQTSCGVTTTSLECGSGSPFLYCQRGMPAGTYYVVVSSWEEGTFDLRVDDAPPGDPPAGDACASPVAAGDGSFLAGDLLCMNDDLKFSCTSWADYKDMFFAFELAEMKDVQLRVSSMLFAPYVTVLRDCADPRGALLCDSGYPFERRIPRVAPGRYVIGVESYEPGEFTLDLAFLPPSEPPANDTCATAVDVSAGGVVRGSLLAAADDYASSCMPRYLDAFYRFTLAEEKDVRILVEGLGVSYMPRFVLMRGACGERASEVVCVNSTPAAKYLRSQPAGDYWIAVEASYGGEYDLEVEFLSPTSACGGITVIESSATLTGSTTGRPNDFESSSSCGGSARSPDRAYLVRLAAPSDVTATISRATFDTVLHLRRACDDPASTIACDDDGAGGMLSMIRRDAMEAGDYILIVDGFGTYSSGDYTLQVTIAPP